jgi:hypothetical protein
VGHFASVDLTGCGDQPGSLGDADHPGHDLCAWDRHFFLGMGTHRAFLLLDSVCIYIYICRSVIMCLFICTY